MSSAVLGDAVGEIGDDLSLASSCCGVSAEHGARAAFTVSPHLDGWPPARRVAARIVERHRVRMACPTRPGPGQLS